MALSTIAIDGLRVANEQVKAKRGSMNWLPFRVALVFSFVASLLAFSASAHAEKRVALVIGNNDYKNVPKLQRPSTMPAPWAIR
jgi:citrate lyase beta subunit